jgi:hypothetical protein
MLKKVVISALKYVLTGGAIMIKTQAIQHDVYNLNNIKPWKL